jgi:hypothetical protein
MSVEDIDTKTENTNDSVSERDTAIDRPSDADRDRSESVRSSIKSAWREVAGEEPQDREERRDDNRKPFESKDRPARMAKEATGSYVKDATADANKSATDAIAQPQSTAFNADGSPRAWAAQARAEWQRLPKSVQDAIVKREKDTAAGVEAIKNRVAAEDRAWQPYDATIKSFGMDRASAVTRMMQWHQSLSQDPVRSYPALAASQGHRPELIVASIIAANPQAFPPAVVDGALQGLGLRPQHQTQQGQQQQTMQQNYDPRFAAYEQRLGQMEQVNQANQQAQAQQTLDQWAKDKDPAVFAKVRHRMAELILAGIAGLEPDGSISLDKAWDAACALDRDVSEQMIAQRIAADRQKAAAAAEKAKRAGVSFGPSSPGRGSGSSSAKPTKGRTVRESLLESIESARTGSRI